MTNRSKRHYKRISVLFTNKTICDAVNFMFYIIISGLNFYNMLDCNVSVSIIKKHIKPKLIVANNYYQFEQNYIVNVQVPLSFVFKK